MSKWVCVNCDYEVEIIGDTEMGIAECENCGIKGLRKDTTQDGAIL